MHVIYGSTVAFHKKVGPLPIGSPAIDPYISVHSVKVVTLIAQSAPQQCRLEDHVTIDHIDYVIYMIYGVTQHADRPQWYFLATL